MSVLSAGRRVALGDCVLTLLVCVPLGGRLYMCRGRRWCLRQAEPLLDGGQFGGSKDKTQVDLDFSDITEEEYKKGLETMAKCLMGWGRAERHRSHVAAMLGSMPRVGGQSHSTAPPEFVIGSSIRGGTEIWRRRERAQNRSALLFRCRTQALPYVASVSTRRIKHMRVACGVDFIACDVEWAVANAMRTVRMPHGGRIKCMIWHVAVSFM